MANEEKPRVVLVGGARGVGAKTILAMIKQEEYYRSKRVSPNSGEVLPYKQKKGSGKC